MLSLSFLARKPLLHRPRRIALLGMFRSGTNYTRTLLEAHYDVEVAYNLLGWKHGLLPTFAPRSGMNLPDAQPLVVVKHPLAFLRSVYRYHAETGCDMHTQAGSWPDFLRSRMVYASDHLACAPQYRFSNPVQMWNAVIWNHVHYAQGIGGMVLRYEDLLAAPEAHCARVAQHYRLKRRPGANTFTVPELQTNRMGDRRRRRERYVTDQPFTKRSFYQDGGYLADYSPEDLAHVIDELDPDLLQALGYGLPDRPPLRRPACLPGSAG